MAGGAATMFDRLTGVTAATTIWRFTLGRFLRNHPSGGDGAGDGVVFLNSDRDSGDGWSLKQKSYL